jgi:putative heme-binding domain-containing protein
MAMSGAPHKLGTFALVLLPFVASLVTGYVFQGGGGGAQHQLASRLFRSSCAFCHNLVEGDSPRYGPPLHGIGRVAGERRPGLSAEEYILESIVAPGAYRPDGVSGTMPGNIWLSFRDDELRALVAFLASQGGTADGERVRSLKIPERPKSADGPAPVDRSRIDAGEALFREKGKCVQCHRLRPDPDFVLRAPSLLDTGTLDAETIRRSILEPSAEIAPGYRQVNVPLRDGTLAVGRLIREDEAGLTLLRVSEEGVLERRFIRRADVGDAGYVLSDVSAMPPMKDVLTADEVEALVAFLGNRHGGYPGYGRPGMFQYK